LSRDKAYFLCLILGGIKMLKHHELKKLLFDELYKQTESANTTFCEIQRLKREIQLKEGQLHQYESTMAQAQDVFEDLMFTKHEQYTDGCRRYTFNGFKDEV
jgi:hypothetical protein